MHVVRTIIFVGELSLLGSAICCGNDRLARPADRVEAIRHLTARDVGEYGGVPWQESGTPIAAGSREDRVRDLNLSIASVNLNDNSSPEPWAAVAREAHRQGKKFLPRVYFWDGRDRFEGNLRDVDVYWQRLDRFLSGVDVDHFCGIVLAEENVNYSGRPEVLAELYRRIKQKYDIPVWQWWSPSTAVPGSGGWIPADGWVVNPYNMPAKPFRRFVRKYLITGKPLVIMPWAETSANHKPMTPQQWKANQDQLDVAVEFNVPVAFYWTYGAGAGGTSVHFGGGRGPAKSEIDRINHWVWKHIERVRALPVDFRGRASEDLAIGDVLELGPQEDGKFVYVDSFQNSKCVDHASMMGFRDFILDGQTLSVRSFDGRPVDDILTYHFAGDFRARFPRISLTTVLNEALNGSVRISLSHNGKLWKHKRRVSGDGIKQLDWTFRDQRFRSLNEFYVRIEPRADAGPPDAIAVQLDDLRIEADLDLPKDPFITLKPSDSTDAVYYEDDFATKKYIYYTRRTNDEHLEWSPGRLAVRMRPGGSRPAVVWQFRSPKPLSEIVVSAVGKANNGSLGTNHYLDVSTDSQNWVDGVSTVGSEHNVSGWADHGLTINLAQNEQFRRVRTFYVRLRMEAESFKEVHPYNSGVVERIRVDARTMP